MDWTPFAWDWDAISSGSEIAYTPENIGKTEGLLKTQFHCIDVATS